MATWPDPAGPHSQRAWAEFLAKKQKEKKKEGEGEGRKEGGAFRKDPRCGGGL